MNIKNIAFLFSLAAVSLLNAGNEKKEQMKVQNPFGDSIYSITLVQDLRNYSIVTSSR